MVRVFSLVRNHQTVFQKDCTICICISDKGEFLQPAPGPGGLCCPQFGFQLF